MTSTGSDLRLRAWQPGDRHLLDLANTQEMTEHLGGPESPTHIDERHQRYLNLNGSRDGRMFTIVDSGTTVGSIGWWRTEWSGSPALETGWFVLPGHQGHGYAARSLSILLDDLRERHSADTLTAFPSVDNGASNRVCERAGFTFEGVHDFPFRGTVLRTNAWILKVAGQARQD